MAELGCAGDGRVGIETELVGMGGQRISWTEKAVDAAQRQLSVEAKHMHWYEVHGGS